MQTNPTTPEDEDDSYAAKFTLKDLAAANYPFLSEEKRQQLIIEKRHHPTDSLQEIVDDLVENFDNRHPHVRHFLTNWCGFREKNLEYLTKERCLEILKGIQSDPQKMQI